MAKRKGLGRGLDALLSKGPDNDSPAEIIKAATSAAVAPTTAVDGILKTLPVELLARGKYQPRRDMQPESLEELAQSIKAQGVMQPIVVRPTSDTHYEIIAGERRWRATQLAGLDTIPAIIRQIPDETAIAMALIENIQREDLNPLEEALALKRLQDEFDLTHQEVGEAVGKSRAAVSNLLRLLNLTPDVRILLEHGDIEMGHARCLLSLDSTMQKQCAQEIISRALSVRQAEALVRKMLTPQNASPQHVQNTKDIQQLEEKLGEHIGVPVQVQHSAKGKGKLVLKYNSLDELDGILAHLKFES